MQSIPTKHPPTTRDAPERDASSASTTKPGGLGKDFSTVNFPSGDGGRPTRCAVMTGHGRAAVAVIDLRGPEATSCLNSLFRPARQRPYRPGQVRYGVWTGNGGDQAGESVVIVPIAGDHFEIHCHGGDAATDRIIADLASLGVQGAPAGPDSNWVGNDRWSQQASELLIRCVTDRTAAIAMDQVRGALSDWRKEMLQLLRSSPANATMVAEHSARIAAAGRIGQRLDRPWSVVLAGPPNVGKSSLINAIVGYDRSIIMDLPGTTRDVLDADTVVQGWPLRLRDTAGLHDAAESIERQGIERAVLAAGEADLIVIVTAPGNETLSQQASQALASLLDRVPILTVFNKADLANPSADVALRTVATSGQGVDELIDAILGRLLADLPPPGDPVPVSEDQTAWVTEVAALGDDPDAMMDRLSQPATR
ncbi:GTPase [Roseiconus nitratireducens]|nr:GTPase [Roseiconus nitratireducens]